MIKFISPFTDSENLYHFTTLDTALRYIIPDSRLKLGSLLNANDPADSKEWFLSFPSFAPPEYDFNYFQDLSLKMKQCIRMTCFTSDPKEVDQNNIDHLGFSNPQMWHYYGDKNKGVCLVFDKEKLLQQFISQYEINIKSHVKYEDSPLGVTNVDCAFSALPESFSGISALQYTQYHMAVNDNFEKLLFKKSTHWEKEREFRLIAFSDSKEDIYLDFDRTCLRGFVLGTFTDSSDFKELLSACIEVDLIGMLYKKLVFKNGTRNLVNPQT